MKRHKINNKASKRGRGALSGHGWHKNAKRVWKSK